MNQHKDLLYRQKYATYQLNNRTFSTQNTKISARSLAISYICFQVRIVKIKKREIKKAILSTTTEILVTPAPPTPDKGSIREIATGEITVSITPDDHLECPYLLKTRELPGALPPGPPAGALPLHPARARKAAPGPHPYEKNRMFQTHTHTHTIGLLAIIYNSFFSSFWSVCKTFFRRKSTQILARSLRSLDIIFPSFLCSSQYNKQDHITSVTNTVMDILYRQTVIYQQCIY